MLVNKPLLCHSKLIFFCTHRRIHKGSIRDAMKKLKHDLALTVPGDFHIVLAVANKLKPTIASFLCGEMRTDSELCKDMRTDAEFKQYLDKLK